MKIIGIIGSIGSGKDTIAEYLIETEHYDKYAFASKVKDVAAIVFGWNREMLEGLTSESRKWREKEDDFWGITPRVALQKIGTELFRKHIDDQIWIKALIREIEYKSNSRKIVITDCRFENEIQAVKDMGGKIIYVQRGNLPEWVNKAENALNNNESEEYKWFKDNNIHATDWQIFALKKYADFTILNNGTYDDLYEEVDKVIEQINK
jgi:hypothetical protein